MAGRQGEGGLQVAVGHRRGEAEAVAAEEEEDRRVVVEVRGQGRHVAVAVAVVAAAVVDAAPQGVADSVTQRGLRPVSRMNRRQLPSPQR